MSEVSESGETFPLSLKAAAEAAAQLFHSSLGPGQRTWES